MTTDGTQHQSDEEQRRAQGLSLKRTRPPTDVPGYEPRRFLGSGAYGEVWVAFDQNTGRRVAIKFYLHRGGVDWNLLSREVEKLVFLSADRYVVQLLDVGWDADPPYYVMEYIENGSLEDRLHDHGPLTVTDAVELFREVAIGLSHAHSKGVLHCDLKPANVLLDQDDKPRLADFGQSRLSHEQSPALGTLFYMAPEQADLDSVPDARWDVYALGALLYCMLTGEAPYRSGEAVTDLESAADLGDRLARYREFIHAAPPLTEHRQVPGMDRALADVIEQCLAIDAEDRFPNVQSVLDALRARDQARTRRPLVMLGFVGPVLLLLIMALFGVRGYHRAVGGSETHLTDRVKKSNEFAAKFVAEVVARKLDQYRREVEQVAQDPQLQELLAAAIDDTNLTSMLAEINRLELSVVTAESLEPDHASPDTRSAREREKAQFQQRLAEFVKHPKRQPLQQVVAKLIHNKKTPQAASWFVTNRSGNFLASAFTTEPERVPIGLNYSWRTYFHGDADDLKRWERTDQPISETHLSAEFQSEATRTWKVAISTPVKRGETTMGLVSLTIELGNFMRFPTGSDTQFAVLVDARDGRNKGVILEHPLYVDILANTNALPSAFSGYRVDVDQWQDGSICPYVDPLGQDPRGTAYDRKWIAAKADVRRVENGNGNRDVEFENTGWVVLLQEDYYSAAEPVYLLGTRLVREGLIALSVIVAVIALLWYWVIRSLKEPAQTSRRVRVVPSAPTPLHSRDTVELPARDPRR